MGLRETWWNIGETNSGEQQNVLDLKCVPIKSAQRAHLIKRSCCYGNTC